METQKGPHKDYSPPKRELYEFHVRGTLNLNLKPRKWQQLALGAAATTRTARCSYDMTSGCVCQEPPDWYPSRSKHAQIVFTNNISEPQLFVEGMALPYVIRLTNWDS